MGFDIIIHIGAPKTGSSSIQKVFNDRSSDLLSQGFYYPEHVVDSNGISGGHWEITNHLRSGNLVAARELFVDHLDKARALNSKLLLSAEGFINMARPMAEILHGFRFLVVAFYRHPVDSFISAYNQNVKRHGLSLTIEEFVQCGGFRRPEISGESLLEWIDVVGKDNMAVMPYIEGEKDVISAFCELLGLNVSFPRVKVNLGYTPCAVEIKRLVNKVMSPSPEDSHRFDRLLQQYSDSHFPVRPSADQLLSKPVYDGLISYYSQFADAIKGTFDFDVVIRASVAGIDHESLASVWSYAMANGAITPGLLAKLNENRAVDGDFYQLLALLNSGGNQTTHLVIAPNALERLSVDSVEMADVFRELAMAVRASGDRAAALSFAVWAGRLRPSGPVIQKLISQLESEQ